MRNRTILLLAAGASSRMRGQDKLLQIVDGLPLILRQAKAAARVAEHVTITLPPDRPERAKALSALKDTVTLLTVPEAKTGMSASFRAAAGDSIVGPVMVLPCDMPDLTADMLERVWHTYETSDTPCVVRATTQSGKPGHPVIFPPKLVDRFSELQGDEGARSLLQNSGFQIKKSPLPDAAATTDLDTPEDWAAWRAGASLR